MFTFGFPHLSGFKPVAGDTPRIVSDWALSSEHSLLVHVRRGDTLRVERGMVWLSEDAAQDLLELTAGAMYTAACDTALRLTGIDRPRVTVLSQDQVRVSARADYGGWRHQPPMARARCVIR